jgi:hypothetical protein
LFVALLFIVLGSVAYYGCAGAGEPGDDDTFAGDLSDPRLQERLGKDDGYAFAILYGADIHGSLETCG